ncbi:MAG TPA: DUF1329 domain-containing protein [Vicinamibacterales bacterium]|nr:DUF1329 domain-containing protein [Vicinamibacterales bacterium]
MVTTKSWSLMLAAILAASAMSAGAAVPASEAEKLKTTLMPMGGEKAANANGTIPAWNGGYKTVAPGWKSGQPRPDPFASEKPVITITASNAAEHSAKLTPGQLEMFKKFPDWKMHVYPTHRTAAAPQWFYDATFKNATSAKIADEGRKIDGATNGGVPFPIPTNGMEVMWNHLVAWRGSSVTMHVYDMIQTADGKNIRSTESLAWWQYPYNTQNAKTPDYWYMSQVNKGPPYKKGEQLLIIDSLQKERRAWQYLAGQRRVRVAPTVGYDTPNFIMSGIENFDEGFVFLGSPERYSWKLVGKKEVYVPYNANKFSAEPDVDKLMTKNFFNTDLQRWELHRVWVVEGTLREGTRHVVPKRTFYVDEDSWNAVLGEGYDAQGRLWKMYQGVPFLAPDLPGQVMLTGATTNFIEGGYTLQLFMVKPVEFVDPHPPSFYTPEGMASRGVE